MIIGIGTDVIEIQRIREIAERHRGFLARTFGPCELEYSQGKADPFPHLAARFAAKEAVMKALGTGWSLGIQWTDITVTNHRTGQPVIRLTGAARQLANRLKVERVHVSLAHTDSSASAQVVRES